MDSVAPPSIAVSIGELEIEGVAPGSRFEVARGLQQELGRLLSEGGVPAGLLAGDAGSPPLVHGAGLQPAELGRAVARALYEGWR